MWTKQNEMNLEDSKFLRWVVERLVKRFGEEENEGYIKSIRRIAREIEKLENA